MLKMLRYLRLRYFGDPPDPTWRAQTPVLRFPGYDPDMASAGVQRARDRGARVRRANADPKRPV